MDLKAFRRDVIKKQGELEAAFHGGFVYLTSVDNREKNIAAGTVTEVTVASAARHLCERTHEISTPAEIEAYGERCKKQLAEIIAFKKSKIEQELRITVDASSSVPATLDRQPSAPAQTPGITQAARPIQRQEDQQ